MLKAVLCDLDGTLVDSNKLHAEAWQRAFQHFGISVSVDDTLHQIGKGGDQLLPVFVPKEDLNRIGKQIAEYRKQLFEAEYFHQVKAIPGSRELLLKMKQAGLRVAIASSASKEDLKKLKEIANIKDLVEEETSSDDAERSKPSPDIFQAALERVGLEASEALALGDTPWDIKAARQAGIATVAVTSGGWQEAELHEADALAIYRDVSEIAVHFEGSPFCQLIRARR
jgi:HAD superfamily hydrolase (TIGR01509 family)